MAVLHDFPPSIHGFTIESDGYHTIVLNARDSLLQNRRTYAHEMEHIENDDTRSDISATVIEKKRHG